MASGLLIYGIGPMLTDAKIKAAKPKAKPYKLSDSGQLYLFVTSAGGRLWRMNYAYKPAGAVKAKQKTLSLGAYPAMTLSDARAARDSAKAILASGGDPSVERKLDAQRAIESSEATFERLAREWHGKQKSRWSKVHAADILRSFERDVFPEIGAVPIADLRAQRLLRLLSDIEDRGAIETAHRLRSRISSVFVYAIAAGYAESDPAASLGKALKPKPLATKQPAITDLDELKAMLAKAEAERCRAGTKLALRLLALTAVRPSELRKAHWSEFEGLGGSDPIWRIPAERMKGTDERKARSDGDHIVPLTKEAVAVIEAARQLSGELELVFPSDRHPHKPMSENTLRALLIRAGYFQRHVPHGFRAAFSTIMNERAQEANRPGDRQIIDLMLAHVPTNEVEASYNRAAFMKRRREIAEEWAELIADDLVPAAEHLGKPMRFPSNQSR
ncbi:tyrosine-type recombinase/integrase [Qipengyuania atrilutea]|nr:integrase arm-type DNA-binding domain-containing protein [Actirhodobacter atriluteus]